MTNKLLMGNEAIGLAAIAAGVRVVAGYPGTPSTEVLETIAKNNPGNIYVEWSVNEKVAMEVAAGAAYTGARSLVTMKQVGLNVASDPLMSLTSVGVKGGMIILVADDPGPISSQTEQDTRHFGRYANLPVFDPSTPEEAYAMVEAAFNFSEELGLPVILRPTTRICHGCGTVQVKETNQSPAQAEFVKDSRWVVFPRLTYNSHLRNEQTFAQLSNTIGQKFQEFNHFNASNTSLGIAAAGIAYTYAKEAIQDLGIDLKLLKIGNPYPFPNSLALEFLQGLEQVLVIEELDGVIEDELNKLIGKNALTSKILGKDTGHLPVAGEYSLPIVTKAIASFTATPYTPPEEATLPPLPVRPPVLCAGCPHRAAFYAAKVALKGTPYVACGDIGCYTLGNAEPLDMVDTCLCMGAGITVSQGLMQAGNVSKHLAFIGDSTFFHSGITGVINGVYNQADITIIILDNSTTAMTGHQPHPGLGVTMMGENVPKVDIAAILKGCGVEQIAELSPLNLKEAVAAIKEAVAYKGVSVVLFKAPCVAKVKPPALYEIKENCTNCKVCIKQIGCPALGVSQGQVRIEPTICYGCSLCAQICPQNAIGRCE